ncbi:MAG: biopolymer transporter ExbD [Planctomycetes bacterium]|nr:biopolymer transporter ExbD [Planctomycetota bacterium]MCB9904923.1 biopolymer transporter ExbD [Planctomycetota bacterium]
MRLVPRRLPEDAKLEMTPMIDVTFLLLIFFLATLRFKTLEGKLDAYLPNDVGPNPSELIEPKTPLDLVIRVVEPGTRLSLRGEPWTEGGGRYRYGSDRVLSYTLGPARFTSFDALDARLKMLGPQADGTPIKLVPQDGVVQSEAVRVLDRLAAYGWSEVVIRGAD